MKLINSDNIEVREKAIRHIAEKTRTTCISLFFGYLISVGSYFKEIKELYHQTFYIFSFLFVLSLILRDFYAQNLLKKDTYNKKSIIKLFLTVLASSIFWGVGIAGILDAFGESTISLVSLMLAAGLSSSALVTLSVSRKVVVGYFLSILIPIIFWGIITQTRFSITVIYIASVYILFLFYLSKVAEEQILSYFENEIKLKKQANELLDAKNLAIESLSYKTDFIAKMSHEVRTPLNGIIGTVELLRHEDLNESTSENIKLLSSSANNLLELVNELLDVSKINAGKYELRYTNVNLYELVEETFNLYKSSAIQSKLKYELNFDKDLVGKNFVADGLKLKQILSNLLSNAIKFTRAGEVNLQVFCLFEREDECRIQFTVEDTGVGLTTEEISRLFRPYVQIERVSKDTKGTGLGLFITNEICKKMGGEIQIESIPNVRTTFNFSVNLKISNHHKVAEVSKPAMEQLNLTVLVVDDNDINLNLMSKYLYKLGCKIDSATSGDQAVFLFKEREYDVILLDIQMPGKDGIQTINELKGIGKKLPKMVAFTANVTKEDIDRYKQCGFNEFLGKPVSIKELRTVLERP